jgi:hypothetical protein
LGVSEDTCRADNDPETSWNGKNNHCVWNPAGTCYGGYDLSSDCGANANQIFAYARNGTPLGAAIATRDDAWVDARGVTWSVAAPVSGHDFAIDPDFGFMDVGGACAARAVCE